jgi:Spy/CpxP family protein refolding chaperone
MKKTGWKTAILVALVVVVVSSPALAGRGGRGRSGRPGLGFGRNMPGEPRIGLQRGTMGFSGLGMLGIGGRPGLCPVPLRILRQLDLTEEQVDAIKEVLKANQEKGEAARKAIAEATKALHEAVIKGDEEGIREEATNLGKALGDGAVLKASIITSVKKVLTDEQRKELDELTAKLKERAEKLSEQMKDPNIGPMFRPFGQRDNLRGQRRFLGRGLGLGAGRGPGMGAGRGWGTDAYPETRNRGWRRGRGPAEEDIRRPGPRR